MNIISAFFDILPLSGIFVISYLNFVKTLLMYDLVVSGASFVPSISVMM